MAKVGQIVDNMKSIYYGAGLLRTATLIFIRDEFIGRHFVIKPMVIQFPVNDICNSRCSMCNIFQRKQDKEITPEELKLILADPLFRQVRYVGLSGGEPTLRVDLPEIGRVIVQSLPKLKGMGIITNALRPQMVIERTLALAREAEFGKIAFNVNVSLDGIGEDHDRNRGVKGNFEAATQVIHTLKDKRIPVSIGCTLTPLNCYGADDLLLWCEEKNIQWEFRLGVNIKRVYNEGYEESHPFTAEQRFHLIMFFDKLARHPRVDQAHRRFYRSLVGQMAFGWPRQAGCDWQSRGVTLDTRGNISYCSVQSPILGCALEKSAWHIYTDNRVERDRIIDEHCDSCQHDLLGPPRAKQAAREGMEILVGSWQQHWRWLHNKFDSFRAPQLVSSPERVAPHTWQHVLITGWYGTETSGDKAILGELLHFLKSYSPHCRITLTTLDRKVSQQTRLELAHFQDVALIEMDKAHVPGFIETVDAVIIGGGPLEELAETEHIWRMFIEANRQRKARIMFGCGIGPLYSDRLREMVSAICQMTTAGFLRDQESRDYAINLGATAPVSCGCDPALAYVRRWAASNRLGASQGGELRNIVGLLRANTREYVTDMGIDELNAFNSRTAQGIAQVLESSVKSDNAEVHLLPMHSIWNGGDDRIFNRQIANCIKKSKSVHVERGYLGLDILLQSLKSADTAIAMRYHGHLFCIGLGIPFLSIDYSMKVNNLIKRIGYRQWSEDWRNINVERASSRLGQLLEERSYWSGYLEQHADRMVSELQDTYQRVFGVPNALSHNST